MKISYVWVEKYKGFTNFAINLASDKRFSYNQDSCSLNMMDNENYIANLFSTKITDVTAIVGKNGVGKTNCLELICTILEGTMRQYNTSFLAIVEDDEKKYTIYHNLEQGIEANFDYEYESDRSKIKGIRGMFFSNIHDNRRYNFGREITYATSNNNYGYRNYSSSGDKVNLLSSQIDLITKHRTILKNEIKISIPTSLGIDLYVFSEKLDFEDGQNFTSLVRKRIKDIVNPKNKFIHSLKYMFLVKLINNISNDFEKKHLEQINFESMDNESTDLYLQKIGEQVSGCIAEIIDGCKIDNKKHEKYSDLQAGFSDLSKIENNLNTINPIINNTVSGFSSYTRYTIEVSEKNLEVIKDINYLFGKRGDFRADWEGVSSGSKAYLTLFTVLRERLKNVRTDTLICIDEGDLYLHPSWQIDFLNNLNKMLPNFSNYNIQLVLTSHSPFLLTDLPHSNVIILEEESVLLSENKDVRTFGSNIYDLYSTIFFLDNQRYGTFATNHIKK
ncbi:AAA family ATPase [Serratia sp. Z4]|nr:AAA family ATPase [Serratia sp. Z4]